MVPSLNYKWLLGLVPLLACFTVLFCYAAKSNDIRVNSDIQLSELIQNKYHYVVNYFAVYEIIDSSGYTVMVGYSPGQLVGNSSSTASIHWTPSAVGNYTITSFVVDSIDAPTLLAPSTTVFVKATDQGTNPTTQIILEQKIVGNSTTNILQIGENATTNNPSLDQLKAYALKKINQDRATFGISPVKPSSNQAAQRHAEDMLRTQTLSHWTSDGMKPYMRYTEYGGSGFVAQNAGGGGYYDNDTLAKCQSGYYDCSGVDPYKQIDEIEYGMMYNDTLCCENGHRDNILDRYHTDVSIGIAYDDYSFWMVQNFENNYIQYSKPITLDNKTFEFTGNIVTDTVTQGGVLSEVIIQYDEVPTHATYLVNKDRIHYDEGAFAGGVRPDDSYYHNGTTILASKWNATPDSIELVFDASSMLNEKGVYTVYVLLQDRAGDYFRVTSHSIFVV